MEDTEDSLDQFSLTESASYQILESAVLLLKQHIGVPDFVEREDIAEAITRFSDEDRNILIDYAHNFPYWRDGMRGSIHIIRVPLRISRKYAKKECRTIELEEYFLIVEINVQMRDRVNSRLDGTIRLRHYNPLHYECLLKFESEAAEPFKLEADEWTGSRSLLKSLLNQANIEESYMKENTIMQFFTDSGFVPLRGKSMNDFDFGFDTGVESDMDLDGYDGIPDTILDVTKDLNDGVDHPAPGIYADYYMFNDPGTRTNPDLRTPPSQFANQLNKEYHKKDLSRIESASDIHMESLEQPSGEFPRHAQIVSQMEPSNVIGTPEITTFETLQQPTMIEGQQYPKGTRIYEVSNDGLFEDPNAKLCPLCDEPYVGDVCPACKSRQPGPDAVKVGE